MEALLFQQTIDKLIQGVGGYGNMTPNQKLIINGLALAGEAGEIANKLKKHAWYSPNDLEGLKKSVGPELGDVAYHLAQLASELDMDLRDIFENSVQKTKIKNNIPLT